MAARIVVVVSFAWLLGCKGKAPQPVVAAEPDAAPLCFAADQPRHLLDKPLRICAAGPDRCARIDGASGALADAPYAEPEASEFPQAKVRTDDPKGIAVCTREGKCARLGGNVANAIVALQASNDAERLAMMAGTTDLKAVMIPLPETGVEVWSVAADKKLLAQGTLGDAALARAHVIGNELVAIWDPPKATVHTSEGKRLPREEMGPAGPVVAIDGARWFAVSEWGAITISDGDDAHTFREVSLVGDSGGQRTPVGAVASEGKLFVSWGSKLYVVDPAAGAVTATWPVPACR